MELFCFYQLHLLAASVNNFNIECHTYVSLNVVKDDRRWIPSVLTTRKETARQGWINATPYFNKSKTSETYFKICSRHWPSDRPMVTARRGSSRRLNPQAFLTFLYHVSQPRSNQQEKRRLSLQHNPFLTERKR